MLDGAAQDSRIDAVVDAAKTRQPASADAAGLRYSAGARRPGGGISQRLLSGRRQVEEDFAATVGGKVSNTTRVRFE
jgi:hypothetical protein